jgi:hypothetical protein
MLTYNFWLKSSVRNSYSFGILCFLLHSAEEDDDGVWDVICGELGTKSATGASRYRAITMLKPAAMEKKILRMSQKGGGVVSEEEETNN